MNNGYRADKVESRETQAVQIFMEAYNHHGMKRVENTRWGFNFLCTDGVYAIYAIEVKKGRVKREFCSSRGWFHIPDGKNIDDVIADELRFITERQGKVHVRLNWKPYEPHNNIQK